MFLYGQRVLPLDKGFSSFDDDLILRDWSYVPSLSSSLRRVSGGGGVLKMTL